MALLAVGCGDGQGDDDAAEEVDQTESDGDDPDAGEDGDAAVEGLPEGTYVVGHEAVTSGPAAFAGVPLSQGAELAVEEINESGFLGDGVEVQLDEQDTGGDPARAISAVQRFTGDGASGVLCCSLATAESIRQTLEESQTPAVITSAITEGMEDPPTFSRSVILLGSTAYGQLISELADREGTETAVMAVTADVDGMVIDGEFWAEGVEDAGMDLVETVDTAAGDTDFSGPATQIADIDPDVVVLSMLGEEATLLVQSLRNRGYEGEIVTTYGISNDANYEIAGEALGGVKFPVAFSAESDYPLAEEFTESYRDRFDTSPDVFAAQGYTAMFMLAHGMRNSGDGDPESVGQAMVELEEMDSVYGPLTIENGQAYMEDEPLLIEWQEDGSFEVWAE